MKCPHCNSEVKEHKNHTECYGCKCTERFIDKRLAAPLNKRRKAIVHLAKNPGLLRKIFNV